MTLISYRRHDSFIPNESGAIILPTKEAIRVQPDDNGFCPVLASGQYCQDSIHQVWHFHAPDGQQFAVDNSETRKGAAMVVDKGMRDSISFLKNKPTEKAHYRGNVVDCKWIVRYGMWVELPIE